LFDSSIASAADSDGRDVRDQYKVEYYFTTLDTVIQDIEDRFNTQATETVRQMSAFGFGTIAHQTTQTTFAS